uniref:Carbonic anhydrase n=1 Tax=Poecilia latipinna TaxID=48699 RepID=A0A3B3VF19_9TELE
ELIDIFTVCEVLSIHSSTKGPLKAFLILICPETKTLFPRCGGLRQSPINIVTNKVHFSSALPHFSFIGHTDLINITVENKGHSESVRLTGGALPGHYRAAQFHFHWGERGTPGSEHTIDGERFPMELHIVHIKEPYSSLEEAGHDMAGIALLALFFEVTHHSTAGVSKVWALINHRKINIKPKNTNGLNVLLSYIIPAASELHSYYRYVGSMTTPGCEQAVAWTVFHRILSIIKQCRFWTGQPMTNIFRPTQPLDGRVVYSSKSGFYFYVFTFRVDMTPVVTCSTAWTVS